VPAGNYARQALAKMSQDPAYGSDFSSRVLANLVSNETDVKQVVTKIELGEADAGIVYKTDALASPGLDTLTIPAEFNVLVSYPISVLADAPDPELARSFVAYVSSSAGQAILAKWGFDTTAR
jgi:molybdate transport system substrate-binding protein